MICPVYRLRIDDRPGVQHRLVLLPRPGGAQTLANFLFLLLNDCAMLSFQHPQLIDSALDDAGARETKVRRTTS